MYYDVFAWLFPDADNFEPKLPTTLTTSNKWEGEDEEEIVKVTCALPKSLFLLASGITLVFSEILRDYSTYITSILCIRVDVSDIAGKLGRRRRRKER